MTKISIRFFNDREVRAVWDESTSQWFFAAVDIVAVLNEQADYIKANNYWRWLKRKLKQENPQLVSVTHGFKLKAADGKLRLTDCFDRTGVIELAKNFPNTKVTKFLDRFLYSDNTIDGQSKKKAYALFESGLLSTLEPDTVQCLQQIHSYIGGLYDFAGQIRTKNISKGGFSFGNAPYFSTILPDIEKYASNLF